MKKINMYYLTCTKANGATFPKEYTDDFGFACKITFQKGARSKLVKFDKATSQYYVEYDPAKAGMKVGDNGYLTLVIGL